MARKAPQGDPNDPNSAEETTQGGDQSPRFRRVKPEEALDALVAPASALPDHMLDRAPVNSKVIVVGGTPDAIAAGGRRRLAVLAIAGGETVKDGKPTMLPDDDPAHLLPIGTKCYKRAEGEFFLRLPDDYAPTNENGDPVAMFAGRAADLIAQANDRVRGDR